VSLLALSKEYPLTVDIAVQDTMRAPDPLDLVRPHLGRVRSLSVTSRRVRALETLFSGVYPAPVRLEVLRTCTDPARSALTVLPPSLPRLQYLTIDGRVDWTHRPWHMSLRRLYLHDQQLTMHDDAVPLRIIRPLLGFLRGMPVLRRLKIDYQYHCDGIFDAADALPVHLPHLTELELHLPLTEACAALCRNVTWDGGRIFLPAISFNTSVKKS
jgi:hypothetical protein